MKYDVKVDISNSKNIFLELNDETSPKTMRSFLDYLPFTLELYVWGDEIYTSSSPITVSEENPKSPVSLNDVAYWPPGKAVCLFYGPTPNSKNGKIIPASPVNIIGKVVDPDKSVLEFAEGKLARFYLKS
jgi:hypothetical protein